ncbi:MAG: 50S ribosomal protein L18 [Alphaproteobacteria bacterium]|nr:50S ribosomal protein L18 [Alphaproteobacteria bacterium]
MAKLSRNESRKRKHLRIKNKLAATSPRIVVFKSLKNIEVQLIDDAQGKTLAVTSSLSLKLENGGNVEAAKTVGADFGKKVIALKLENVVFDRSGYIYHGRVQALADAIRNEGVKF